jgi:hypothetical protein
VQDSNRHAIEQAPRRWRREAPRNLISTQRCAVADLLVRLAAADLSEGLPEVLQAVGRAEGVLCANTITKRGA